jgi:hypothetical protein
MFLALRPSRLAIDRFPRDSQELPIRMVNRNRRPPDTRRR